MASARIRSRTNLKRFIDWIKGVGEPPGPETTGPLEAALAGAFVATQAKTHIISGSLKASGKTESDLVGHKWTGEITYGGPLIGPPAGPGPAHDPVEYAIYEAARGPEHDPLAGLEVFDKQFEAAIDEHFKGRKRRRR